MFRRRRRRHVALCLLATLAPLVAGVPTIFPLPRTFTSTPGCLTLPADFALVPSGPGGADAFLLAAIARANAARATAASRAEKIDVCDSSTGGGTLATLAVFVAAPRGAAGAYPALADDESYTLALSAGAGSALRANSVWGALRGLESFSQLLASARGGAGLFVAAATVAVDDAPRWSHRGLLVDTGRAFLPVSLVVATLDAMAYAKLNVFHWHVSDDQAFPLVSTTYPNLTLGAMQAPSSSHTYSPADVALIIQAAAERGIRVMPEFDVPGHSTSWFAAFPFLQTVCDCPDCGATFTKPMDPTLDTTYAVVEGLFTEMMRAFPDAFYHIGGDEVDPSCWLNNSDILAFMKARGYTSVAQLQGYFEERVLAMFPAEKRVVMWEENAGSASVYPEGVVVHAWKERAGDDSVLYNLTLHNYTVLYTSPSWYLDWTTGDTDAHVNSPTGWASYHQNNPGTTLSPEQQKLLLGGEVSAWNVLEDTSNFMSVVFPRAAAVAERLWSADSPAVDDPAELHIRMRDFRCRLVARGIDAAPVEVAGSCGNTGERAYTPPYAEF
jgi:hexosaminidase